MKDINNNMSDHNDIENMLNNMVLPEVDSGRKNTFKEDLKSKLLLEFDNKAATKSERSWSLTVFRIFSNAAVTAIVMPFVVLGGVSTYAYYSPHVYDGHILYPVKISMETAEYSMANTPEEKAEKKLVFAVKRLEEVQVSFEENDNINEAVLSQVAVYTLSAVQDVRMVEDNEAKEALKKQIREFSGQQVEVIASLEDRVKESSYLTYSSTHEESFLTKAVDIDIVEEKKKDVVAVEGLNHKDEDQIEAQLIVYEEGQQEIEIMTDTKELPGHTVMTDQESGIEEGGQLEQKTEEELKKYYDENVIEASFVEEYVRTPLAVSEQASPEPEQSEWSREEVPAYPPEADTAQGMTVQESRIEEKEQLQQKDEKELVEMQLAVAEPESHKSEVEDEWLVKNVVSSNVKVVQEEVLPPSDRIVGVAYPSESRLIQSSGIVGSDNFKNVEDKKKLQEEIQIETQFTVQEEKIINLLPIHQDFEEQPVDLEKIEAFLDGSVSSKAEEVKGKNIFTSIIDVDSFEAKMKHIFREDPKPQKASQEEALEYIKNMSNVLMNIDFSSELVGTSNRMLYEPKLKFTPSLEDYKIEDYYYLVQSKNYYLFYVSPYFVDSFEMPVPRSIYDESAEIFYTIDNSDPFTSVTRNIYIPGEVFEIDRNMTVKLVIVSEGTVSPIHTVQVSIVK